MLSQYRAELLLLSHNFSNVMINNTSSNEAHYSFQRRHALMNCPVANVCCIPNIDLLRVTNEDAPCLRIVSTVLNMLEESLQWLLEIPGSAHVFKLDLEVDCGDVSVGLKEVVQLVSC
jgi:hypothetical protein